MKCYVTSPYSETPLPKKLTKENTLFYPEAGMTQDQLFKTGRPKDFHIVTDSPFLVPLYDNDDVRYVEDGKWVSPRFQTYGCSYNVVMGRLWDGGSIPFAVLNGKTTNVMGRGIK